MKYTRRMRTETKITLGQLKRLMFWAKYGVEKADGGTYIDEIEELICELDKRHGLQIGRPKAGKYVD